MLELNEIVDCDCEPDEGDNRCDDSNRRAHQAKGARYEDSARNDKGEARDVPRDGTAERSRPLGI